MRFEKLYKMRKERGFTHADMSDRLNISKAFYCQIEKRNRGLSYKMAHDIANILECKPDEIFYDEIKISN